MNANAEQVRRGMAWVFDRYVKDRSLYSLQEQARDARLGLGQTHQRYHLGNGDKREVRWNIAHRSSLSLSEVGQNPAVAARTRDLTAPTRPSEPQRLGHSIFRAKGGSFERRASSPLPSA